MKRAVTRMAALSALAVLFTVLMPGPAPGISMSLSYPGTGACTQGANGLANCINSATDGATISIKPGVYVESGTTIDHSVTLTGNCGNQHAVTIDPGGAGDGFDLAIGNVTIECMTIRHATYAVYSHGAYNNLHVLKVTIQDFASDGVYQDIAGTNGLQVENSTIWGGEGDGVYTAAASSVTITGNILRGLDGDCVYASGLTTGTVSNNLAGPCDGDGFYAGAGSGVTYAGNKFHAIDGDCIDSHTDSSTLTKNTISGCNGDGFYVVGNSPTITSNLFNGQIDGDTIEVNCGDNAVVESNTALVANDDDPFIYVCQNSTGAETIKGNVELVGLVDYGIECSTCDNADVEANKILGGGESNGIDVSGKNPKVLSNIVSGGWDSSGFYVDCTGSCSGGEVEKNVETGSNGDYGFELYNDGCGSTPGCMTVSGNSASENESAGFYVSATYAVVSGNKATNNGESYGSCGSAKSGFAIIGGHNVVSGNTATGTSCDGFYVSGDGNTLSTNMSTGNIDHGFQVTADSDTLDKNTSTGNGGDGFNNDGTNTVFTNNKASGNRQDCTSDTTGGETATIATNTGNSCKDGTNFSVTSTLTSF